MPSILDSIKKLLGINLDSTFYDDVLIIHINSVINTLAQLGVGTDEGFKITSNAETWDEYIGNIVTDVELIKTYIYLSVKVLFDPPLSSSVLDSMNKLINEYGWRINVMVEGGTTYERQLS